MAQSTTKQKKSGSNSENTARQTIAEIAGNEDLSASEALLECCKQYAKERPEVVTLWAFGVGFVLGWKLKPW